MPGVEVDWFGRNTFAVQMRQDRPQLENAVMLVSLALAGMLLLTGTLGNGGSASWAEPLFVTAGAVGFIVAAVSKTHLQTALKAALVCWLSATAVHFFQSDPWPIVDVSPALAGAEPSSMVFALAAADPMASFRSGLYLAAIPGLFLLGHISAKVLTEDALLKLILAAVAGFAAVSLLSDIDPIQASPGQLRHPGDAVFPFSNRNTFCLFAGIGAVIAAAKLSRRGSAPFSGSEYFWVLALVLCCIAVIASHSRAGLAAVAVGVAIVSWPAIRHPRRLLFAAAIAGGALIATLISNTGLRFLAIEQDLAVRGASWRAAAEIASHHLWFGIGSLDLVMQAYPGQWGDRHIQRAHNIYLQSIAERGLPASLLLATAVGLAVLCIARANKRGIVSKPLGSATLAVLAMFAIHGLVDFSVSAPINASILAILLGAATAEQRRLPSAAASATTASHTTQSSRCTRASADGVLPVHIRDAEPYQGLSGR